MKTVWILPLALLFLYNPFSFFSKDLLPYYLLLIVFCFYCFFCEGIFGIKYIGADVNNICISILILVISYSFGLCQNDVIYKKWVALSALSAGFAYALIIYIYFLRGSDMFSIIYAFDQKNSAGQIILSCCILGMLYYTPKNKIMQIAYFAIIAINTYIIFYMKSRATLASLFFVIAYFALRYNDKRVRWLFCCIIISAVAYIYLDSNAYHIVVDGILLANRDATDLNELSSDRVVQFDRCIEMIQYRPFFGNGIHYFDSFPVSMLVQFGLIGTMIMFYFIFAILKFCANKINHSDKIEITAFLLMISFLINSLFEAQPPFGPGVKCFLLWVAWGIMLSQKSCKKY